MGKRVDHLEYSLMELGTELFQLKHQLVDMNERQDILIQGMRDLKGILDEKGLITKDDFENHVAIEPLEPLEEPEHDPLDKLVKREFH